MSERILVGTRKGLFTLDRTGTNGCPWTITRAAFIGDAVSMVLAEPDTDRVHAALDHGHFGVKMHRSSDNGANGATWQEIAAPMYPERPADAEDLDPIRNEPIPWSTKLIWSLEAGHPDQPGILWCGTIPGGLFRSDDGGDSWALVRSLWDHPRRKQWFGGGTDLPGIHSIIVDPRDGNHVTVGVSCGGVWMTFDGGATWECRAEGMWAAYMPPDLKHDPYVQDPHRVVQCLAQPDYLWAQHHNGVFRTTSGAVSWEDVTSVEPSVAGFTAAVHPYDPNTAWFVPMVSDEKRYPVDGRVVVSRTRDGGQTFKMLTSGLPQEYAFDLTYRHALDVDASGDLLVFGSTTGSLWVSEDQGDSWLHVSAHLPPIYCTRFVEAA